MVPGPPKLAKQACLKEFFTVAMQPDDLGPHNLLRRFFSLKAWNKICTLWTN